MSTRIAGLIAALNLSGVAPAAPELAPDRPDAAVDLRTREGVALVKGQWRYRDVRIIEVDHQSPGPDLRPSGPPNRTHNIEPQAGGADFDDSSWQAIEAPGLEGLEGRRSTGRLCFNWYRIKVTLPDKVASFDPTGSTVFFEIVIDDYAEVWVNGKLPVVLGQMGGPLVKGFNAPNRVLLGREVKPGQQFQIAVFGMNAPVSSPPGNFIWVRSATLDFYRPERARVAQEVKATLLRRDPAIDAIVPNQDGSVTLEKLAQGFGFIEGPVWVPEGYLLFSDPNNNVIYRWTPDEGALSIYRTKSGYSGFDIGEYGQPGSNGLALDRDGRLTMCEHGNRRISRLEKNGVITVLADRYEGKRLNSPNDLVYRSDGALYFTDPPFGLPRLHQDSRRELPFTGVFRVANGELKLVSKDLSGPNGLAFSPDEKYLYVSNWDNKKKVVMRYQVQPDGSLGTGQVFFDMTAASGEEALDGLKVDGKGNLYVSGPGGLWILSSDGKHLGTLQGPELAANFAWGDADGRTLYLTARSGLYRIRLNVPGVRPFETATN